MRAFRRGPAIIEIIDPAGPRVVARRIIEGLDIRLREGDPVHLIELEDGILITPYDPEFEEALEIYEEGAKRYRNAMRQLAE